MDWTRISVPGWTPAAFTRSATGTPVQLADWLQPSTHAIGSSAVVCGIAASSSREYCLPATSNRHDGSFCTPADAAVRFTGSPCGPFEDFPARADTFRSRGTVAPAVAATATP